MRGLFQFMRPGLTVLALILVGCNPESSRDGLETSGFQQWDSAGVMVAVTDGAEALASLSWRLDSLPMLALGADPDPDQQFYGIAGVQGLRDGGIMVVNGGTQELRFLDAEGRLVRSVGRKGEGPGEFLEPALVRRVEGDSLLLWDIGLRRLQLFSPDGVDSRTVPLADWPWGAGALPPVGAVANRLLIRKTRPIGPDHISGSGAKVDSVSFVWLDPGTGETTLLFLRSLWFLFRTPSNPPVLSIIPFTVRPAGTVIENGALITEGTNPEIRHYGPDGRLRQIDRIAGPNRPVTEEGLRAYVASQVAPEFIDQTLDLYHGMPIPAELPWFDELKVDATGLVWAHIYEPDRSRPKVWVVFDKDGRALGTVSTPSDLKVEWIGEDRILGVWLDELGIEYVHEYGLVRTADRRGMGTG